MNIISENSSASNIFYIKNIIETPYERVLSIIQETIKALRKINCKAKIIVGGAVVTEDIARRIGADYYSSDALALVNLLAEIIKH